MILNKENLNRLNQGQNRAFPHTEIFKLPEKVLQFGTGVLLRGLPDYFIDKANKQGLFNGRVVVVKSTAKGETSEFDKQDGLYTICVRGIADQKKIENNIVCSSISRVVNAGKDWDTILEFAGSPDLEVIISNTTEAGIRLIKDDIRDSPPISFPGKLLAVLYKRYQTFGDDETKGLVILPTELISDNGKKLKEIVIELASQNSLDKGFVKWLSESNRFCNTLVDRIVPGKPKQKLLGQLESELIYKDELIIVAEVYKLWAIEGDEHVKKILSFASTDPGVVITPNIDIYSELKLRLLNGTHTLSCGLSFLAGIKTVKEAMDDEKVALFISNLMLDEISAAIPYPVPAGVAVEFSNKVLDRFRNPHIEHHWLSISVNYTTKVLMRVVPVLKRYYELFGQAPARLTCGFAAYFLFMRSTITENGSYYGQSRGEIYLIDDDKASLFFKHWQNIDIKIVVNNLLSDTDLWNVNLTELPGFADAVILYLEEIMDKGVQEAISKLDLNNLPT